MSRHSRPPRDASKRYHDRVARQYDSIYDDPYWHFHDELTWRLITGSGSAPLPNIPINSIALDPANPTSIYYAGTDVGFFASKDGGLTWQDATTNLGLPTVQVNDVKYVPGTGYLMAATFGRGLWRIQLPLDPKPSYFRSIPKSPSQRR